MGRRCKHTFRPGCEDLESRQLLSSAGGVSGPQVSHAVVEAGPRLLTQEARIVVLWDLPAGQIYAGGLGLFATNPTTGDLYHYLGSPFQWARVGGPGRMFAVNAGHLYGLSPDGSGVWQYTGDGTNDSWTPILTRIALPVDYIAADDTSSTPYILQYSIDGPTFVGAIEI